MQIENAEFIPTKCAICETGNNSTEIYRQNLSAGSFNPDIFSARRLPDKKHYRIVKCAKCGLVRSDPIIDPASISALYSQSKFNYSDEVINLKASYGKYLLKLKKYGALKNRLLDIGCGNGFFLEEALSAGYLNVFGIEPSISAVEKASPVIKAHILTGTLKTGTYEDNFFDVICLFQVLDHLVDPGFILKECYKILKPGGLMLFINHNIDALSSRFLKENSPIIDIEHTFLYSPDTMKKLLIKQRFIVKESGAVFNRYSIKYLINLSPLSFMLKNAAVSLIKKLGLENLSFSLPLGNLYLIAQK